MATCQISAGDFILHCIKDFNFDDMTVTIRQGVTYAKGNMLIGDPKTPAGKCKMFILPGLLETLELSEAEKNDPEAYIIPSLKDPHEPISFQADRRLWERVKTPSTSMAKHLTVSGTRLQHALIVQA